MEKPRSSSDFARICAWCGLSLDPVEMGSREWRREAAVASAHTHTICDTCLLAFFAEDFAAGSEPTALQPVATRRRA